MTEHSSFISYPPDRLSALSYRVNIIKLLLYVFPFLFSLCYASIVPGKQTKNPKGKEAFHMKKLSSLIKEFYQSFSHREG